MDSCQFSSEIADSIDRVPKAVDLLAPVCRVVATLDNSSDPPRLVRWRDRARGVDRSAPDGGSASWDEIRRLFHFRNFRRWGVKSLIDSFMVEGSARPSGGSSARSSAPRRAGTSRWPRLVDKLSSRRKSSDIALSDGDESERKTYPQTSTKASKRYTSADVS